ncbi:MAG: beta-propeller domain-containing protein [Acidimicrobiales bacterium]
MRPIRIAAAAAAFAVVAVGCSGDDDDGGPGFAAPNLQLVSSLERFDSCDEVETWARDELAPRVSAYGLGEYGYPVTMEGDVVTSDDATSAGAAEMAPGEAGRADSLDTDAPQAPAAAEDADGSFSETNVQVEGVDEPDIVKTDGDRILVLSEGGQLHLASAERGQVVDSVQLPEGVYSGEMLLSGDRALVFANTSFAIPLADDVRPDIAPPQLQGTRVVQVDIAGDELTVSETFEVDGNYVSARMTDDVVRLVLHADPQQRLPFVTPANPTPEAEDQARRLNQDVVEQAAAEDLMPRWRETGTDGEVLEEGTLVDCENAHAPQTFAGFGMVSVVSIDVSEGLGSGLASLNSAGVMAGGQTVYASAERLYVAAPEWVDWATLPEDEARVASEDYGTDVHRFDISDPEQAVYEMSGHVDGMLLNQFAMDEHDGNLRVATTTGSPWGGSTEESESQVVVLEPGDGALTQVGAVTGLGRGETIHSVRFLGDVGYVVTFEQTDPLFTLDLADPANPQLVGELEMLGYSAYLHPIGDGRLIGVGQDATEEGAQVGTQVSLFDVSDPAAPARVAQAVLPNTSSGAEWDHRAFLWWADTNLAAIPISSYQDGASFEGLVGYGVDVDGEAITELGRVSHPSQPGDGLEPLPIEPGSGGSSPAQPPGDREFAPELAFPTPILRSLVIGDRIWTVSGTGVASSDLATLGDTTFIPFA